MNSGQSTKAVVFVNAIRHSNRVGLFAAKLINALVKEQQPTDPLFEVRQDDEQPPAKARKMTKVQRSLNNNTAYLRPVLKGNPRRFDSAMVFFDPEFYTKYQSLMDKDWSMGSSKYCPVATFISALLTVHCGITPVCTQDCESTVNTVLAISPYRAQCFMLSHCVRLLLECLPDDRKELLLKMSQLQTGTTTSQGGSYHQAHNPHDACFV